VRGVFATHSYSIASGDISAADLRKQNPLNYAEYITERTSE